MIVIEKQQIVLLLDFQDTIPDYDRPSSIHRLLFDVLLTVSLLSFVKI